MGQKTIIKWSGKEVAAEEMEFKAINENWNEYELEDGSRIKIKLVCGKIIKIENEYDDDGNPVYRLLSTNVLTVTSPSEIRRKE